jgi:2'-5' RNA ligase
LHQPIAALAAKVDRACLSAGVEPERRAFHSHVTLARWKGRRTREFADVLDCNRGLASDPFAIEVFTLFESHLSRHGAHYGEVASYRLGKNHPGALGRSVLDAVLDLAHTEVLALV